MDRPTPRPAGRPLPRLRGLAVPALLAAAALAGGCASTSTTTTTTGDGAAGAAGAAPADAPAPGALASGVTVAPGDVVELSVWGMSCPKCVTNIDRLLMDLDGVTEVRTDMSRGLVTVGTGGTAPRAEALADVVTKAGFTLMGMRVVEGGAG